jgi:hypothetical protein
MPLEKSKSKAAVGRNIRAELAANPRMPTAQAVAIALDTQRRAQAPGKPAGASKPAGPVQPADKPKTRQRVPQRDGAAKRLAARIAQGGAL